MKAFALVLLASLGWQTPPAPSTGAPAIGAAAPTFTLTDDTGANRSLMSFRGKFVVLEWHSNECPYVAKHYGSGNMQALQREWTGKSVVWLAIESAGPGEPGFVTAEQSRAYMAKQHAQPTAVLLDPTGQVGHSYGARTALHMAVIDPSGVLIYLGGIDDRPTTEPADVPGAHNYVRQALEEATRGRPVTVPLSKPYGCAISYAR